MKISKRKRNIILLCIGVLSVILAVWTERSSSVSLLAPNTVPLAVPLNDSSV